MVEEQMTVKQVDQDESHLWQDVVELILFTVP